MRLETKNPPLRNDEFRPKRSADDSYSGEQQNWPTQRGPFVNTQFGLPIYVRSYPNRSYNVIGYLEATTTRLAVTYAAQRAKRLGADAMIVIEEGCRIDQYW